MKLIIMTNGHEFAIAKMVWFRYLYLGWSGIWKPLSWLSNKPKPFSSYEEARDYIRQVWGSSTVIEAPYFPASPTMDVKHEGQ